MGRYDQGDRVELYAAFTDNAGAPTDPSDVTFRVKAPDDTVTDYTQATLTNPAVGDWRKQISLDQPGLWRYRVEATGAVEAAGEANLLVRYSPFP